MQAHKAKSGLQSRVDIPHYARTQGWKLSAAQTWVWRASFASACLRLPSCCVRQIVDHHIPPARGATHGVSGSWFVASRPL